MIENSNDRQTIIFRLGFMSCLVLFHDTNMMNRSTGYIRNENIDQFVKSFGYKKAIDYKNVCFNEPIVDDIDGVNIIFVHFPFDVTDIDAMTNINDVYISIYNSNKELLRYYNIKSSTCCCINNKYITTTSIVQYMNHELSASRLVVITPGNNLNRYYSNELDAFVSRMVDSYMDGRVIKIVSKDYKPSIKASHMDNDILKTSILQY